MVAGDTGADYIFPGVLAVKVARGDVVYGQLLALLAAILAGVVITVEDSKAGEPSFAVGTADIVVQLDYRRNR